MSMSQLQQQNVPAAAAYTEYSVKVPPQSKQVTFNLRSGNQPVYWYMASSPNHTNNLARSAQPSTTRSPQARAAPSSAFSEASRSISKLPAPTRCSKSTTMQISKQSARDTSKRFLSRSRIVAHSRRHRHRIRLQFELRLRGIPTAHRQQRADRPRRQHHVANPISADIRRIHDRHTHRRPALCRSRGYLAHWHQLAEQRIRDHHERERKSATDLADHFGRDRLCCVTSARPRQEMSKASCTRPRPAEQ